MYIYIRWPELQHCPKTGAEQSFIHLKETESLIIFNDYFLRSAVGDGAIVNKPLFLIIHLLKRTSFCWSVSWLKSALPADKWRKTIALQFDFIEYVNIYPADHNKVGTSRINDIHSDLFQKCYHVALATHWNSMRLCANISTPLRMLSQSLLINKDTFTIPFSIGI